MPHTYRVTKPHQSPGPEPWIVRQGERLSFERRETEWPGWIWCTNDAGKSAWVPESWVQIDGDSCVLKRDYDATALSVVAREVLTVETNFILLGIGVFALGLAALDREAD